MKYYSYSTKLNFHSFKKLRFESALTSVTDPAADDALSVLTLECSVRTGSAKQGRVQGISRRRRTNCVFVATCGAGTITATFVAKTGQLVTAVGAVWRLVTDQAALDTGTNHTLELERLCTRATRLIGIVDAVILFIAGELLSYTPIIGTAEKARRAGAHRTEFQQFI
jgi:hypothetical protein